VKFEHANDVPQGAVIDTDVCVIGSGAAGITLARELDGAKPRVLVLEAGGLDEPATEHESFSVEHLGTPYASPLPTRGRSFGGSTNLWVGRMAMLDRIDMDERPWVPFSGWPLGYDELEPWVRKAASLLDVPHFDRIRLEPWSASHPAVEAFVEKGGAHLGVFLWANGFRMGPYHRDAIRSSPNVRLMLESTAIELVPCESSKTIESLTVRGSGGNCFSVKASTYVVAAGGLENPRLLLASTRRSPNGVGNERDLVGRFYMDHLRAEPLATVELSKLAPSQLRWLSMLGDRRGTEFGRMQFHLEFPASMQKEEGLLNHCLHADFASEIHESEAYLGAMRLADRLRGARPKDSESLRSDLVAAVKGAPALVGHGARKLLGRARPTRMFIIDQMEQEPDPESRVTVNWSDKDRLGLPRLRLDWRIGHSTYASQRRMHRMFKDILERLHIRTFRSTLLERQDERPPLYEMKHPSGTTKMSRSPATGVVDADLRVHGVDNLYVAGSSTFPTVGHANPTLTIVALAVRLADHLRRWHECSS
jgi:choline dehydrogenase-like flavoprotein